MSPEALNRKSNPPASGDWHGLRLSAAIGHGRSAEVWSAHVPHYPAVAVKFPAQSFNATAGHALVRVEAKWLARFAHPHIVRCFGTIAPKQAQYDDGSWNSRPGLVLELLDGGDLVGVAGLPVAHWRRAALAVLDALEYLHAHNYVHGDVKARNVIFAADGSVRLVDFVSCLPRGFFCTAPIGTALQQRPRSCGHIVSEDDDLFAFAALLYELMAGRPAFVDEQSKIDQRPVRLERQEASRAPGEQVLESAVWAMLTARRRLDRSDAQRLRAVLSAQAKPDTDG
jgi:serine/threonine protein kinase